MVNICQRELSNSPSKSPSTQASTSPSMSPSKQTSTSPSMSFGCDRFLALPPVPNSNIGDTSFDVTDMGDFGISDFRIEMDVTGKGFDITGSAQ